MDEEKDSLVIDALKEISNIAAARLTEVVNQLTGKEMSISVPKSNIIDFTDTSSNIRVMDTEIFVGYSAVAGDVEGSIVFFLTREDAIKLVETILDEKVKISSFPSPEKNEGLREFPTPLEKEALGELIFLTSHAYLDSINQFLETYLTPQPTTTDIFEAFRLLNFIENTVKSDEDYATKEIVGVAISYNVEDTDLEGEIMMFLGPNILEYLKMKITEKQS
jgi:chemotaxis protein CheY-P-specific phosphatase CheC